MLTDRPDHACVCCPPPHPDRDWRYPGRGYRVCDSCLDRMRDRLNDIAARYLRLSARPSTGSETGRGSPGYGSRSPASDQVIALTDRRSRSYEVSWDDVEYSWDPDAQPDPLPPGVHGPAEHPGAYVKRYVWFDAGARPHTEHDRGAPSVRTTLAAWAQTVAEARNATPPDLNPPRSRHPWPHTRLHWRSGRPHRWAPDPPVVVLCLWLDRHLDWITRHEMAGDLDEDLRRLDRALRTASGEPPPRQVGRCPNTLDAGATTTECGTPLFAPLRGDTIVCTNPHCRRVWPRPDWEKLGQLLQDQALAS